MDIGLLILRLLIGATLAAHGAQKLFGWFGGYGIAGTGGYFDSIGFRPGKPHALLAGLGEAVGGLALGLGFLTPIAAAILLSTMLVAITVHLDKGFFAQAGGYELPLIIAGVVVAVAFAGPGNLSVDAALGHPLAGTTWGLVALVLGLLGAVPPIAARAIHRARNVAATA
jgi:putative oxidoreductase